MPVRHQIRFPRASFESLAQDEVYFVLAEGGEEVRVRFHDYDAIYRRPGLYEQHFHERLACESPREVVGRLAGALEQDGGDLCGSRVLDLGAGNGLVGEEPRTRRVARIVGIDVVPEARDAAERDRPGTYDDYLVLDLARLDERRRRELEEWRFDVLVSVAALGFGDIPVPAFAAAFELVVDGGWVAFNIKDRFLSDADETGFARFVRALMRSDCFDLHHLERYRHRLSIEGRPLHYFAVVGRKRAPLTDGLRREHGMGARGEGRGEGR